MKLIEVAKYKSFTNKLTTAILKNIKKKEQNNFERIEEGRGKKERIIDAKSNE